MRQSRSGRILPSCSRVATLWTACLAFSLSFQHHAFRFFGGLTPVPIRVISLLIFSPHIFYPSSVFLPLLSHIQSSLNVTGALPRSQRPNLPRLITDSRFGGHDILDLRFFGFPQLCCLMRTSCTPTRYLTLQDLFMTPPCPQKNLRICDHTFLGRPRSPFFFLT